MQTRTNPFVVMAGLYLTVGLLAVVGTVAVEGGLTDALPRLRWLTIHFVTIGGMTQALFGLLPSLLESTGGTADRPREGSRWLQWLFLNAGYPLVLLGMATGSTVTAVVGATLVLVALGLLLVTVRRVSASDQSRHRAYRIAPWFLVVGIAAAFGMLLGLHGPGGYFGSLEAHVHANVWGFLALVVAGTLLTVLPTLFDADIAYPRLASLVGPALTVGAAGLVAGPWLAIHALTIGGLAVYVVGTVALLANVVGTYRASDRAGGTRLAHVLGAYLWLVVPVPLAPLVLLFPETVPGAAIETAAIDGLVFGWMLQLAMAFLPLLAVADVRSGPKDLVAAVASARDRVARPSWIQVASVNLGMLALWLTAVPTSDPVAGSLALGGYLLVGVAWVLFVASFWRAFLTGVDTGREDGPARSRPASR